jgi:hypothetical protein
MIKVYHLTHKKNRNSIIKNGLIPMSYTGTVIKYKPRIFVSNSKKTLAFDYVGYDNVDVWELQTEQTLFKDLFSSYKGHFYLKKPVGPDKLKLIKCY